MKIISLLDLCDLPDGKSKGAEVAVDGSVISIFIVRQGDKVYAYLNRCPHTGSPLDWLPDRFLDATGQFILCATHGAIFRIQNGLCIEGPCVNQGLQCLNTTVERGVVNLLDPYRPQA